MNNFIAKNEENLEALISKKIKILLGVLKYTSDRLNLFG